MENKKIAMEWPFPISHAVPSVSTNVQTIISSAEAYACTDQTFMNRFRADIYLQTVFGRLCTEGSKVVKEAKKDPALKSAMWTIASGLLTRADFAANQMLLWEAKWVQLLKKKAQEESYDGNDYEKEMLLADVDEVKKEIRETLLVVKQFQELFTPHLDLGVSTLENLSDSPLICDNISDDDTEASSEEGSVE